MDGQPFPFESVSLTRLYDTEERDKHFDDQIIHSVFALTISRAVYILQMDELKESDIQDAKQYSRYESFQYYGLVSDIVLIDLTPSIGQQGIFLMTLEDSKSSTLYLKSKFEDKSTWFNWIRYLQFMDDDYGSCPFSRLSDNSDHPAYYNSSRQPLVNLEHMPNKSIFNAWNQHSQLKFQSRMDQLSESLFKCEELQKLLDSRIEAWKESLQQRYRLQERHRELIKKMDDLREYQGLVDKSDATIKSEWRNHSQTLQSLQEALDNTSNDVNSLKEKRNSIIAALIAYKSSKKGLFSVLSDHVNTNWISIFSVIVALWMVVYVLSGVFSWK